MGVDHNANYVQNSLLISWNVMLPESTCIVTCKQGTVLWETTGFAPLCPVCLWSSIWLWLGLRADNTAKC